MKRYLVRKKLTLGSAALLLSLLSLVPGNTACFDTSPGGGDPGCKRVGQSCADTAECCSGLQCVSRTCETLPS